MRRITAPLAVLCFIGCIGCGSTVYQQPQTTAIGGIHFAETKNVSRLKMWRPVDNGQFALAFDKSFPNPVTVSEGRCPDDPSKQCISWSVEGTGRCIDEPSKECTSKVGLSEGGSTKVLWPGWKPQLTLASETSDKLVDSAQSAMPPQAVPTDSQIKAMAKELVEGCYTSRRNEIQGGVLQVSLGVQNDGFVWSINIDTSEFKASRSFKKDISDCVLAAMANLPRFAPSKQNMELVLPFTFQHTVTAGSGPQESCWNPKGCPGQ